MAVVDARYPDLFTITSTGFGKRSPVDDYRETRRGAHGVRTIRTGGRNGEVVAVLPTGEGSEVLVTTQRGITIRLSAASIRSQGRNTLGVRIIRLDEGDEVKDVVLLPGGLAEGAEAPAEGPDPGDAPPGPEPEADEDGAEDDEAAQAR
jgi:DNA gyrase subunit A